MPRTVVAAKRDHKRLLEWKAGRCPYCRSLRITRKKITKKIRPNPKPQEGNRFSCDDCGSVNTFTKKAK